MRILSASVCWRRLKILLNMQEKLTVGNWTIRNKLDHYLLNLFLVSPAAGATFSPAVTIHTTSSTKTHNSVFDPFIVIRIATLFTTTFTNYCVGMAELCTLWNMAQVRGRRSHVTPHSSTEPTFTTPKTWFK